MNIETIPVATPSLQSPSAGSTSINPLSILPPAESDHRGNGKVARLPKVLRDQVNRMLDDGVPYKAIIEKLEQSTDPPLPYKLLEINISRWKDFGYQHYLRHQEWRDELRLLRENGSEMTELNDGPKFQETLIQIALTDIFRVLQQRELKSDSLNYIRLFNALARLNREALSLRKYNDLLAKERTEQLPILPPDPEETERQCREAADQVDMLMGIPRPDCTAPPPTEAQRKAFQFVWDRHFGIKGTRGPGLDPNRNPAPSSPNSTPTEPAQHPPEAASHTSHASHSSHLLTPTSPESTSDENSPPIKIQKSKIENCLDCGAPLPPVRPNALRRPEDHCPSCGMRLPDIGLCAQPGFDHCLNCGATQPHLLPNGKRPRNNCHKCGERLHNPEPISPTNTAQSQPPLCHPNSDS